MEGYARLQPRGGILRPFLLGDIAIATYGVVCLGLKHGPIPNIRVGIFPNPLSMQLEGRRNAKTSSLREKRDVVYRRRFSAFL